MNLYDFDGTIYAGDSSADFYLYLLKKHPGKIIRTWPRLFMYFLGYNSSDFTYEDLMGQLWSVVKDLDLKKEVENFWNTSGSKRIRKWYLDRKKEDDVIISASPNFLLKNVSDELGVNLLATLVDEKTGKIEHHCSKDGKLFYLYGSEWRNRVIEDFFSDSEDDLPLAKRALHPYMMKKGNPEPWIIEKPKTNN